MQLGFEGRGAVEAKERSKGVRRGGLCCSVRVRGVVVRGTFCVPASSATSSPGHVVGAAAGGRFVVVDMIEARVNIQYSNACVRNTPEYS